MIARCTEVVVAVGDERDQRHRVAARDLRSLQSGGLGVTSLVLCESLFLMPERYLRQRLEYLLRHLGFQPARLEDPWWAEVFSWLDRYADHEPDLADAELAILSSREKRHKIWTYDREFREIWRRGDGSRLPVVGTR